MKPATEREQEHLDEKDLAWQGTLAERRLFVTGAKTKGEVKCTATESYSNTQLLTAIPVSDSVNGTRVYAHTPRALPV